MFWIAKLNQIPASTRRFEARRWKQFGAEHFFLTGLHLVNLDLLKSKQSQMIGKLPKTRYSKLFVLILNSMAFWCKKKSEVWFGHESHGIRVKSRNCMTKTYPNDLVYSKCCVTVIVVPFGLVIRCCCRCPKVTTHCPWLTFHPCAFQIWNQDTCSCILSGKKCFTITFSGTLTWNLGPFYKTCLVTLFFSWLDL